MLSGERDLTKPGGHDLTKRTLFTQDTGTRAESIEITMTRGEEDVMVRLNGRLNIESSPLLRDRLLCCLRDPSVKTMTIDLTNVSYIDSSGVATLIEALKFARHRSIRLQLNGAKDRLLHLLEVTGLAALFETNSNPTSGSVSQVSQ